MGPFSPVEMAHWEKSCETWQGDVWTFSLDVMIGPNSWYMVVSPFRPKSSQYTFGCLSPSDWEKGKNWKRLPFSGVWQKTTFSPALSALKNRFLKWGFQYQTLSILSPSGPIPLGKRVPKIFGNFFLLPLQHFESPHQTATSHQRISPKPVGQKKKFLTGKNQARWPENDLPSGH